MPKTIHLRIKKEMDSHGMQKVLKFKGALIKGCYTEIIHIADKDEMFHLNFFTVSAEDKKPAEEFIRRYIQENNIGDLVFLINDSTKPVVQLK